MIIQQNPNESYTKEGRDDIRHNTKPSNEDSSKKNSKESGAEYNTKKINKKSFNY